MSCLIPVCAGGSYLDAARKHGAGGAGAKGHDGHVNPGEVKPSASGGREVAGSYAMEPAGPLEVPPSTQAAGAGGRVHEPHTTIQLALPIPA
jgi:hypothetical protein